MKPLIPKFIEASYGNKQRQGRFSALALFVDLTDFTPLTEAMMTRGKEGAEQLSLFLNSMFGPLVKMVYEHDGFVPYFAGDAFHGIFAEEKDLEAQTKRILALSKKIRDYVEQLPGVDGFKVGVKQGISLGTVEWGILGNDKIHSFYFRGSAISRSSDAQNLAKEQEIVLDHSIKHLLPASVIFEQIDDESFYKIIEIPFSAKVAKPKPPITVSKAIARKFLPNSITDDDHKGEFRYVLSVFLSFEGAENHEELDEFVTVILNLFASYGGYFKEVDFGDKGGVLVGFFGAPVTYEDNDYRAMEVICSLKEHLTSVNSKIKIRGGLTKGTSFTGSIGGDERAQYAIVGNQVNLAARLMMKANWNEIWVEEELAKNNRFLFQKKGKFKYKGVAKPMPTYELMARKENLVEDAFLGPLVGRHDQFNESIAFILQNLRSKKGSLVMIYGEAGVGKSIFLQKLKNKLAEEIGLSLFKIQPDTVLSRPFHGFILMLKNLFEQTSLNTKIENRVKFDSIYNDFLLSFQSEKHKPILNELERTRPFIAELVGIPYENSVWDQLDAKGRYENSVAAMSNLVIAQATLQPTLIEFENAHTLDENSIGLLKSLIRRINKLPLALVFASRVNDDQSKPTIFQDGILGLIADKEYLLKPFDEANTRKLAETFLHGKVSDKLGKLLFRISNGNPFYIEQFVQYFAETNILTKQADVWTVEDSEVGVSDSIQSILTARIDRLSTLAKETVKTAAVIGEEFEVNILSAVMSNDKEVDVKGREAIFNQIKTAEQVQIWQAVNELKYIFKHSMLREAVYGMQLNSRLRELHQQIGAAIEIHHAHEINRYWGDLAFHFQHGGMTEKAKQYLKKAADQARDNFQNNRALELYDRLISYHKKEKNSNAIIKCLLKEASIYELIGQWDNCEKTLKKALKEAQNIDDSELLARPKNELGRLYILQGDYAKSAPLLKEALEIFERIKDQHGISKAEGNLGTLYFRKGEYEEAKPYLKRSIARSQETGSSIDAQIVSSLGLAHMNQGNFDEGIQEIQQALEVATQYNDKRSMATLNTFAGVLQMEKDDHNAALESLKEGLTLSESLGNKLLICITTGSIGRIYLERGDFDAAMKNFKIDLAFSLELGDKQGIAIAHGLVGELLLIQGKFAKARKSLKKSLKLSREIGYQKGIAKAENNLGDIFYLKQKFKKAQKKYKTAVKISRAIDNKIVLGESLLELAQSYLSAGDFEKAHECFSETTILGQTLGNQEFIFASKVLGARMEAQKQNIENAIRVLRGLLETALTPEQEAEIYYRLFDIDNSDLKSKVKAIETYSQLAEKTPQYLYKYRLQELSNSK